MNEDKMKDDEMERKKNLGKFEFKIGGRGNVQRMCNAIKFIDYIENLPSYKMFGVKKLSRGIIVLTKEEVVPKKKIEELIENESINISGFECISVEDIQELLEGK